MSGMGFRSTKDASTRSRISRARARRGARNGRRAHRSDGEPAYARRFRRAFGFYEGVAAVDGRDGWRHIGPDGTDRYAARYAWCGNFQGGRCTVREPGGAYLHVTHDRGAAYGARWRYAGDFREGSAVVRSDNGLATHIGPRGEVIHGTWFVDLASSTKGSPAPRRSRVDARNTLGRALSATLAPLGAFYKNGRRRSGASTPGLR